MKPIQQFRLLGLITLLVFPLPAIVALYYFEEVTFIALISLEQLKSPIWLLGIELGLAYGFLVLLVTQHHAFEKLSRKQEQMLQALPLTWGDVVFISFAAGFGEELLFRAGIQHWIGPVWTSVLFVAVHGYFNPTSWRKSLQGMLVLPFILLLAFAYDHFGIWFCIAAHFSYDLLLFSFLKASKPR